MQGRHIKLVVIGGQASDAAMSPELHHAASQQLRSLPIGAPVRYVHAAGWRLLEQEALAEAERLGLDSQDMVLLLAHPYLVPAPACVERLTAAAVLSGAALAFTSSHPCPALPPDYFTVRGIDRYVTRLADLAPSRHDEHGLTPEVLLVSVGHLRRKDWFSVALCVPGAYTHDFAGYHQGDRKEIIPLVPRTAHRVLDVGGGEGRFLTALKAQRGCEVELAEYAESACRVAARQVDRVWHGDFPTLTFEKPYDCITFLDVLEHTEWPAQWLRHASQWLTPGGTIIASIPNVGHWSVVADLLEGYWDYAPAGIHCITHLRFFTRHGIAQLFEEAGFDICDMQPVETSLPEGFDCQFSGGLTLDPASLATVAYLVVAKPRNN